MLRQLFGKRSLHKQAYDSFERGDLAESVSLFTRLLEISPHDRVYHYMLGLVHKYRREWAPSLRHNLLAVEPGGDAQEQQGQQWNAAIAATALADWPVARQQWRACGIDPGEGEGSVTMLPAAVVVRLNPWGEGETVFVQRIDPARALVKNVPTPASGHRFNDLVLTDGAVVGHREAWGRTVPVFNELQLLEASEFLTFSVFVHCPAPDDAEELERDGSTAEIGLAEDWTNSLTAICLRCSHGTPHSHDRSGEDGWSPERNFGIAARDRGAIDGLLQQWVAKDPVRRKVEAIEQCELAPLPHPQDGQPWWMGPEDDDQA